MDEIKGIRIVSLTGEKEYGIEDSEARQNVQQLVEGAPEAFDTFKEIAEYIAEDGATAAEIIKNVAANAQGIADEITRAKAAEEVLEVQIADEAARATAALAAEKTRAEQAEAELEKKITEEKERAADEIEKIKDGDTIAAQAREIHSRNGKTVTDSFLARTTAGSGTIGDGVASLKSVGGNVIKNLVDGTFTSGWGTGNSTAAINNGIIACTTSVSYGRYSFTVNLISGHKFYVSTLVNGFGKLIQAIISKNYNANAETRNNGWTRISYVTNDTNLSSTFYITCSTSGHTFYTTKPLVVDLTEMFGAGNEPDQATCDRLFGTMDALPQGLTIAKPNTFTSTGFNQFNPENVLEGKAIDDNAIVPGDKKIAVIPCLPCKVGVGENNGYCIHGDFGEDIKVYLTPLNPMGVEGELYMHELTKDATTDTYVPLIKGYLLVEVPTTANLCAHFLWSEDKCKRDTYEPYFESKIELPTIPQMSEWGLAGIQSSGTPVCDEIDFERGVYIKRIGCIEDASAHKWSYNNDYGGFIWEEPNQTNIKVQTPFICDRYPYIGAYNKLVDKAIGRIYNTRFIIRDSAFGTDINAFKVSIAGVKFYYELAEPIEYPLPKVDNNYISSDYGVEQFDSAVPCNANNLYYMRSLAGETRNFLDRLYDNTDKADAKEVADYITNGIEGNKELATNAPNLALRALFIAAGAEYNDTDSVKTVRVKYDNDWNTTAEHLPGHYYLNGLGDITEKQMIAIYENGHFRGGVQGALANNNARTNLSRLGESNFTAADTPNMAYTSKAETICLCRDIAYETSFAVKSNNYFYDCYNLRAIYGRLIIETYFSNTFYNCTALEYLKMINLKANVNLGYSPMISKKSILYAIQKAAPTSAITITLHADAYARLANDADVVAALAAQPLVTLVSA